MGFHANYYIPEIKKIMFKNIKIVGNVMDKHIQILKKHGVDLDVKQDVNNDMSNNDKLIINKD